MWHVITHWYALYCIRHHSEYVPKALAISLCDDLPQGAVDRAEPNALQHANIMNSMSEVVGSLRTSNIMHCDFSWVIPYHPIIVTQPPAKQGRICTEWTDNHEQSTVLDWAVRLHNVCCKFGDKHTLLLSMSVVHASIKRKKTAFSLQIATTAFSHLSLQPVFSNSIPKHVRAWAKRRTFLPRILRNFSNRFLYSSIAWSRTVLSRQ